MQELVQKKVELAELSDSYEQVCHAFLKADAARYGKIIASLDVSGISVPNSVSIIVSAK